MGPGQMQAPKRFSMGLMTYLLPILFANVAAGTIGAKPVILASESTHITLPAESTYPRSQKRRQLQEIPTECPSAEACASAAVCFGNGRCAESVEGDCADAICAEVCADAAPCAPCFEPGPTPTDPVPSNGCTDTEAPFAEIVAGLTALGLPAPPEDCRWRKAGAGAGTERGEGRGHG